MISAILQASRLFFLCEVTNLKRYIIRLTSVTYAVRAQKLLEQRGIRSHIKKIAKDLSIHGCGYGLELADNVNEAVQLLGAAGIRMIEVIEA